MSLELAVLPTVILSLDLLGLGKLPDVESLDFLVFSVAYSWLFSTPLR
jgi:high-affinity nickel permease